MGWYGLQQAILAQDDDEIAAELSPRRNPNDPGSALYLAVRLMTEEQRCTSLAFADGWLRDPSNNCLCLRGDARWQAMSRVERVLRAYIRPVNSSADL